MEKENVIFNDPSYEKEDLSPNMDGKKIVLRNYLSDGKVDQLQMEKKIVLINNPSDGKEDLL